MNPSQDKVKELINNLTRAELLEACVRYAEEKVRRKARKLGAAAMEDRLTKLEGVVSEFMGEVRGKIGYQSVVDVRPDPQLSAEGATHKGVGYSLSEFAVGDRVSVGPMHLKHPLTTVSADVFHHIAIDPTASPSGIPFSVALEFLKAGRTVCCGNWMNRARVEPRGPGAVDGLRIIHSASLDYGTFEPCLSDLLATNWVVLPQEPAKP